MKIQHIENHRKLRRESYPQTGDQIDDLWRILEALAATNPAVQEALNRCETYRNIRAIKERYPKPK